MSMFLAAALLGQLPLDSTVRLTPEVTGVKQGDPLLLRIDVRFGVRRPSHYPHDGEGLSSAGKGLVVSVRKPDSHLYELVRDLEYGGLNREMRPADRRTAETPGKADAAFLWVLADLDFREHDLFTLRAMGKPVPEPRLTTVFNRPGVFLIRARLMLRDAKGVLYYVYSEPIAIQVEAQAPAAQKASDEVRPILFYDIPACRIGESDDAEKVRAALPLLGESGAAAAIRRVLPVDDLRAAAPGEPRRKALAACDQVRGALTPLAQGAFDLDLATALRSMGERKESERRLKTAPDGPRKLSLSLY